MSSFYSFPGLGRSDEWISLKSFHYGQCETEEDLNMVKSSKMWANKSDRPPCITTTSVSWRDDDAPGNRQIL